MYIYFQNHNVPHNVWLGVTVENSKYSYRIDILKKINEMYFMKGVILFYAFINGKNYQQTVDTY
mgnify:CR=1 FL=1